MPQILINREQLPHLNFDVELLGDCDVIINELCHRLGGDFEQLCYNTLRLSEITEKPPRLPPPSEQPPCEALSASSEPTPTEPMQEEQKQHSTDSLAKPSVETTVGQTVTRALEVPPEPCPKAQCPYEETTGCSERTETADGVQREDTTEEDTPREQPAEAKNQHINLELRRRCWMSRISRSPISKRLESKNLDSTY